MGLLGCAQEYSVQIADRYGQQTYGVAFDASRVEWGRVLDDTSEARVTIPYQGPECCGVLGETNPWCNDIVLYRDDVRVWEGPVSEITYAGAQTHIVAKDVTRWLWWRKIRELLDFSASGSGGSDLTNIALALVLHGFELDDPNIVQYLQAAPSGVIGERRYEANSALVGDAFQELARTGIDYTAIGRRILIGPEVPLARLPGLTDEHFAGELEIHVDGTAAATAATVVGKGSVAEAGGAQLCGLLEVLQQEDDILDATSAQAEADSIVAAGWPPPAYVHVPPGSGLDPDAPVGINELICGIIIPVTSSDTCRTVATDLRLHRLAVTFDSAEGERVGVTLIPPGRDSLS